MKPVGDKIFVRRDQRALKTETGIFLAPTSREKPNQGTVVSVGDGRELASGARAPFTVKPGDRVVFANARNPGPEITVNGETLLVMKEEDLLCILN
jgi:chaperonin GroES